jgi:glutathione peroxidase
MSDNIYQFDAPTASGESQSLSEFTGKVLLIVNTASQCGFTPQYDGLQSIYDKYKEKGFEVLGFPCNQFGKQEPGTNEEINTFCETRFHIKFPIFAKVDVNGDDALPLYDHLKQSAPGILGTKKIKWNFTKFLINREGQVIKRFAPRTKPEEITQEIESLL